MFIIYNLIYSLFIIFYLPSLILKRKFHKDIFMRLGLYPKQTINQLKAKRHIWLHAVSVGEAIALTKLIAELKRRFPKANLVISTVTVTGNKIAKSIASKDDAVIYLPLDFDFIIRKVINIVNPSVFVTIETELWPKLIKNLYDKRIPIVVVNGRISKESFKGYKLIRIFMRRILKMIDLFCMRTRQDAERIVYLGAPKDKVKITGNIKFDFEVTSSGCSLADLGTSNQDMLFVAGSTHDNEEEIILKVYNNLIGEFKNLRLLIAPRHIERVNRIDKLAKDRGFKTVRFSEINPNTKGLNVAVYLLDTIGQLQSLYNLATVVFMGGSLVKKGGHNIIEPAFFAKPIIFGPHMQNFQDTADLFISNQAAIQINNEAQLQEKITDLLRSQQERDSIGERAKRVVQNNKGVIVKTLDLMKDFLA